ncbi:MAG TPA: hypothetical protein VN821_13900 [Candidatus Udaeobacter sp.]|nr:hypothetical protein [Candidatus Udaeobacter sp.]
MSRGARRGAAAGLLAILAALSAGGAEAQQACWQVASSNAPGGSPSFVLVNQCTGQTWQLVRTRGVDQNGTVKPNEWVWSWQPIAMPATPGSQ